MAVTAARSRQEPGLARMSSRGTWQASAGMNQNPLFHGANKLPHTAYSTGTTISLLRTMFKRLRAADSMARGLLRSCSISDRSD